MSASLRAAALRIALGLVLASVSFLFSHALIGAGLGDFFAFVPVFVAGAVFGVLEALEYGP